MPEDFRTWNEVDRRTGDTEQMLRVNRRTPEDRPDRMMTNPLLNPDPLPKPESVCRLTELNNGGTPRVDFRQGKLREAKDQTLTPKALAFSTELYVLQQQFSSFFIIINFSFCGRDDG